MVSLTSAVADVKLCRSADGRNAGNRRRSRLFFDAGHDHQHRPDRHEWQSDEYESESSQRDWFDRQQLDDSIRSELEHDQWH